MTIARPVAASAQPFGVAPSKMQTMLQKVIPLPAAPRHFDPARGAARLLGWIGFTTLMVGAPLVGVLSRHALFVLLPIGAGLLLAAFLLTVSSDGLESFREALRQPIGLAVAFLGFWMGLSLLWTPFPSEAIARYAATVVTALAAALIVAHVPERRARPTLYLMPGGVAVTAVLTLGMALLGPPSFRGGTEFDSSLLERSVLTLVILVWPALGALAAFGRWTWAMLLAMLVFAVVTVVSAKLAMAVFALGALTFALAGGDARRTGRATATLFGVLMIVGPALPFLLAPAAAAVPMVGKSTLAAMTDWRDLVTSDGVRLITGHGLDTARRGVVLGYLPPHTPRSILFEVWYELGILGALALAGVLALGFRAAADAASFVAPALLAGFVATFAVAFFGVATAQLWFVTLVALQAVGFGLLCRSSRGGRRALAGLDATPSLSDHMRP